MGFGILEVEDIARHVGMPCEGESSVDVRNGKMNCLLSPGQIEDDKGGSAAHFPLAKPLQVIVNRFECASENGKTPDAAQIQDVNGSRLLKERDSVDAPPRVLMSPEGPMLSSYPSNGAKSSVRYEEITKRRTLVDKIERARVKHRINSFVSQCDSISSTQMGMAIRKFGKKNLRSLSSRLQHIIMEDGVDLDAQAISNKRDATSGPLSLPQLSDPEASDSHEFDEPTKDVRGTSWESELPSASKHQAVSLFIERRSRELDEITTKATSLRSCHLWQREKANEAEEGCARIIPINSTFRRYLHRISNDVIDPSQVPSTSKEPLSTELVNLAERRMVGSLHRYSTEPPMMIRKNLRKSIWLNWHELEEEKRRNGLRRKEERDKRLRRQRQESDPGRSDSYEETDESEEDEELKEMSFRKYGHKSERRREKRERKKRKFADREGFNPPLPVIKLGRRGSGILPPVSGQIRPFLLSRPTSLDMDELLLDPAVFALPQKMEYKEISVPSWRMLEEGELERGEAQGSPAREERDELSVAGMEREEESGDRKMEEEDLSHEALSKRIEEMHAPLEQEERRRFQAFREANLLARGSLPMDCASDESYMEQDELLESFPSERSFHLHSIPSFFTTPSFSRRASVQDMATL